MHANFTSEKSEILVPVPPEIRRVSRGPDRRRPWMLLQIICVSLVLSTGFWVSTSFAWDIHTRPYLLQTEDPSEMQMIWHTSTDLVDAWVRWGYSEDNLDHITNAFAYHQNLKDPFDRDQPTQDFNRFEAWIRGAAPGLPIYYKVFVSKNRDWKDSDAVWTTDGMFMLPLPASAKHVAFFGYGDTRSCEIEYQHVTIAMWNAMKHNDRTFVLHSGDVVFDGGKANILYDNNTWLDYFSKYNEAKRLLQSVPVAVAMGNHEFDWAGERDPTYFYINWPHAQYHKSTGMIPHLRDDGKLVSRSTPDDPDKPIDAIDDAYYSFDYGPVHVAVLNSYHSGELDHLGGCHIGSGLTPDHKQYDWLVDDLQNSDKDWKIILQHVAPYSYDCYDEIITNLIQDNGLDVDLIVSGHDHYYFREIRGGINNLVLGGGGADLDKACDSCSTSNPSGKCPGCFFHYARFEVVDDNTLNVVVMKVDQYTGAEEHKDEFYVQKEDKTTLNTATFLASTSYNDYRVPVRFSCTTPGKHKDFYSHIWDFGDGTSNEVLGNPLHYYPRPTDPSGKQTYYVSLTTMTISDGEPTVYTSEKQAVTVYIKGGVEPLVGGTTPQTPVAYFLRPAEDEFDEALHFLEINKAEFPSIFESPPGNHILTVRAPGYQELETKFTVIPDKGIEPKVTLVPVENNNATVVIASVPNGADVTIHAQDGGTALTGTTPFYADFCCPGSQFNVDTKCTVDYTVEKAGVEVHRVGWLTTTLETKSGTCKSSDNLLDFEPIYVYIPPPAPAEGQSTQPPVIIVQEPGNQQVVNGGQALLRIRVHSSEPVSYRWYAGESGDTSRPIHGAAGSVYITRSLKKRYPHRLTATPTDYWVRVHTHQGNLDSHTVSVSLAKRGPMLVGPRNLSVTPGELISLRGTGFDQTDPGENRVFFDEYEGAVQDVQKHRCNVIVPQEVADREKVNVRIMVDGVWSRKQTLESTRARHPQRRRR